MINFDKTLVFDPKIEIVGEEVPLAAMEKTGTVLQDRFDKAYEQYSLADEALKQMEASANPIDRDKAKELRSLYSQEMQGILQKGDFHNMRHQVSALARNAAANYKTISEKNAKIQANIDAIRKDPRYQLDPEGAVQDYLKNLKSIEINPETRTISDFNVGTYGAAADVNIAEKALKIAPTIRTKTRGGEEAKLVQQIVDGQPIWIKVSKSGKTEFLSAEEINRELSTYLKTDAEIQSYIARDVGRMGYDINTDEGKKVYNQLLNERINNSTKALGQMYSVDNKMYGNDFQLLENIDRNYGKDKSKIPGTFTQRLSNIFNYNLNKNPFEVDENGNIKTNISSLNQTSGAPAYVAGTYKEDFEKIKKLREQGESAVENSTEYKRLKSHLTHLGRIPEGASKKDINKAIVDFWNNEINNAQSSIAVAKPGDEQANKYIAEINQSYFGTPTPDANTKGSSILNGQLAQASFIDEKGKLLNAQQVFEQTKDRNVRVNGWVNQIQSPFEYGSHYMVAVNPENGEQKHYLIEPDLNTKNSGAYFANRILNSTRQSNLVSKWQDGMGVNYEATPVKGGKSYLIYINNDDKLPITLEENDLDVLAQLPSGQANNLMMQLYLSKKSKK